MDESAAEAASVEGFDEEGFRHLLRWVQDGVVSRRQLVDLNAEPHDIRRMLRRRELAPVHPGVYVEHTGPLTWEQRAWAAVLHHWPAALARESALPKPPKQGPIHVAIAIERTVKPVPGVFAHRTAALDERVNWRLAPPRVELEHAAVDVALTKIDVADRFRVFADACQTRETTAAAIAAALTNRNGIADKQLMLDLLTDLESGACSVLEREYLRLERLHGLPEPQRQLRTVIDGRNAYRDVPYENYRLVVELDGKAFHDNAAARDRDFERDLATVVVSEALTVRLTYGQVFTRGCRTIRQIATLLERRGWPGTFRTCSACADSNSGATR